MSRRIALAYIGIVAVNIVWGLSFIASKIALEAGFTPFTLAFVRFAMAGALLLPLTLGGGRPRFSLHEWMLILVSALFGITLYFLFEYVGLEYTTASNASLILSIIPVLTMISGVVLHNKRYPLRCWAGVAVSLFGVYLVVRYGGGAAQRPLLGNLLLVCACLCWVAYIEVANKLLRRHGALELSCYQSIAGMLTLLPLALWDLPRFSWALPAGAWGAALFLGIVCSAACYIAYNYSMRHLAPVRTALFINLNPISAVLGGAFLLGEQITARQLLGGVIILVSIMYVSWTTFRADAFDNHAPEAL